MKGCGKKRRAPKSVLIQGVTVGQKMQLAAVAQRLASSAAAVLVTTRLPCEKLKGKKVWKAFQDLSFQRIEHLCWQEIPPKSERHPPTQHPPSTHPGQLRSTAKLTYIFYSHKVLFTRSFPRNLQHLNSFLDRSFDQWL